MKLRVVEFYRMSKPVETEFEMPDMKKALNLVQLALVTKPDVWCVSIFKIEDGKLVPSFSSPDPKSSDKEKEALQGLSELFTEEGVVKVA